MLHLLIFIGSSAISEACRLLSQDVDQLFEHRPRREKQGIHHRELFFEKPKNIFFGQDEGYFGREFLHVRPAKLLLLVRLVVWRPDKLPDTFHLKQLIEVEIVPKEFPQAIGLRVVAVPMLPEAPTDRLKLIHHCVLGIEALDHSRTVVRDDELNLKGLLQRPTREVPRLVGHSPRETRLK